MSKTGVTRKAQGEPVMTVSSPVSKNTLAVIKVVGYDHTIAGFPDAHTVDLVERQLAREKQDPPRWISR